MDVLMGEGLRRYPFYVPSQTVWVNCVWYYPTQGNTQSPWEQGTRALPCPTLSSLSSLTAACNFWLFDDLGFA